MECQKGYIKIIINITITLEDPVSTFEGSLGTSFLHPQGGKFSILAARGGIFQPRVKEALNLKTEILRGGAFPEMKKDLKTIFAYNTLLLYFCAVFGPKSALHAKIGVL